MNTLKRLTLILLGIIMIWSCSKKDDDPQVTGFIVGSVIDATNDTPLGESRIIVFNADTNEPVGEIIKSGDDGQFSIALNPGNYYIRISRQGYIDSPPKGITAVPFTVTIGETDEQIIELYASDLTNLGIISGKVTEGENPVPGVLVVGLQTTGDDGYSSITDQNGEYVIYNIPANTYNVKAWISDYNSNEVDATISNDSETSNIDIALTSGALNTITGQVRNLASENIDVDVALIHRITRETIPGLTTQSENQVYTISGIPDGVYVARATFENDERVMDPDRIAKFGEPVVELAGGISIDLSFDITGAISINNPTNETDTNIPFEIVGTNPTFEWTPYSSTSDYIIEVMESNGNVIWGGFDNSGTLTQKNIIIPSGQTSIEFNADGNASNAALELGKVYRWRIFASKDDKNSNTGWTLISASEDQMGLIKVIE
jgi:hypothetical protein